ncbi:Proline 4-hydroxylase (includes Rps23 Pro-64 3,4-dihydroxylase Tpa1), contains SM-20 domain [Pseudomonas saponiphila]|uniref:Proline 4-hydroxylase (Includes Rps23 Pro-64 3,4-dihydroxylase Tpa1), contains SM-20 domain n=2 Tax=Pseudomonas saponiphila TaxID=556534 RepID=A0A1H4RAS1_9PSED|nr:2OG-Fe(II) oxygenase family protein [Pseudomonas saponiphila]SEC28957.1 Proline 4-hydroxylase (includes Rps23 Pro-64 3,4-dihydroxylase Tpa1), contains SM-20 domain [Pseudomonas saponiphila]
MNRMLDLTMLTKQPLHSQPFRWGQINDLYSAQDAAALAATYPHDAFKRVYGYGGEKDYEYQARQLVEMGTGRIVHLEGLSPAWRELAAELSSEAYRLAMSGLTDMDLRTAPMEINVFHYGPQACLGPHPDLSDKLVTHILYFNESWNISDGGCLNILGSADPMDVVAVIPPLVGHSAVLVRADHSWHAVSKVVDNCRTSRRSMTVTFYRAGSLSSMWPAADQAPLHDYEGPHD